MAVTARGKGWQARIMLDGTRYVAQFETRQGAEIWEAEARVAHAKGQPVPMPGAGTARAAGITTVSGLLQHCERVRWRSLKSGAHLAFIASKYVQWVGPNTPVQEALSPTKIDAYVQHRVAEKHNAGSTINRHLSAISVLAKEAKRQGLVTSVPELHWQREGQGRLKWYEDHELNAILSTCQQWGNLHYFHLFAFLADTGARLGEAEKLEWRDIKGKRITFVDTKNGESRTVVATERVMQSLEWLRERCPASQPFEWLDRDHLRRFWERLRTHLNMGDDCVVHTFRHTCASRLVQRGVDLYRVKQWMGHKSLSTTMRYAHLAPKHMEELADVLGEVTNG